MGGQCDGVSPTSIVCVGGHPAKSRGSLLKQTYPTVKGSFVQFIPQWGINGHRHLKIKGRYAHGTVGRAHSTKEGHRFGHSRLDAHGDDLGVVTPNGI